MLVYFTDAISGNKIAINPTYVTGVFLATDEEHSGKTVVALLNGSFLVAESQLDVVGTLQGVLK